MVRRSKAHSADLYTAISMIAIRSEILVIFALTATHASMISLILYIICHCLCPELSLTIFLPASLDYSNHCEFLIHQYAQLESLVLESFEQNNFVSNIMCIRQQTVLLGSWTWIAETKHARFDCCFWQNVILCLLCFAESVETELVRYCGACPICKWGALADRACMTVCVM